MRAVLHSFFAICMMLFAYSSTAQTTITTSGYINYWTGTYTSAVGITFVITNTNTHPILLKSVGYAPYTTDAAELYYNSTSLSGITTPITSANNWTLLSSVPTPTISSFTIVPNFFSGLSLVIPAGTTYRFAVLTTNNIFFGSAPITTGPYNSGGVSLNTDNAMWGAASLGLSSPGYNYYGSITFDLCAYSVGGLNVSNITSTSANLSWGAVSGSAGYDYAVTTSATGPASGTPITATSASVSGLTPGTSYWLHVRNKCSATSSSGWTTFPFKTNPPCTAPILTIKDLNESSAKITWTTLPHAVSYEFSLSTDPTIPASGAINNTGAHAATGLAEGTKYYVYIKMNCEGGETSGWVLDSFTTKVVCRPPSLITEYINTNAAVVYWKPVLSAYKYEYEISQSPTPLGEGTAINTTSFRAFPLKDGQTYYFHVRSQCNDQGFVSKSEWGAATFRTFPTSVKIATDKAFSLEVYPNPVKDLLTLNVNNSKQTKGKVVITDVNGKMIYNNLSVDTKTISIDLAGYTPGVYLLKYADDAGNSEVIKIVKQ